MTSAKTFWLPVMMLCWRELAHFWRERSRVIGFVASPIIFWLVIGSGYNNLAAFFPGALTLTVMFAAIFSTYSIIDDRKEGFLLSMLVSPAPRSSMVLGKVLGGSLLSWVQGLLVLAFLPLTGIKTSLGNVAATAGILYLIAFSFTALGFLMAWKMESSQGFHALMNLLLFPMWMVSGALFSFGDAHSVMQWVMRVNPLTYSTSALKQLLLPAAEKAPPSLSLCIGVTLAFGIVLWIAATMTARRRSKRSNA